LTPLPMLSKQIVVLAWIAKDVFTHCVAYFLLISAVAQPAQNLFGGKKLGGAKCVILGKQQCIVWDAASQSTK